MLLGLCSVKYGVISGIRIHIECVSQFKCVYQANIRSIGPVHVITKQIATLQYNAI